MLRAKRALSAGCLICLIALVAGCRLNPNLRGPQKLEESYERQLKRWTVSGQVHHNLDRVLYVHATYLSSSFRQAFKSQYYKVFSIDPGKVDTDLEMIAASAERGHEFFFFTDTSDFAWNNMEDSDSVWRMALWGGEDQPGTPPVSIHRFRGRGPNLSAFFPYLSDFGRSYYAVFPVNQANGEPILDPRKNQLTVKMSSAFGEVTMIWKVEE